MNFMLTSDSTSDDTGSPYIKAMRIITETSCKSSGDI